MQYIDSVAKNNERTYRVENKKQCHNVQSVNNCVVFACCAR